jgi:hypothetical protein
MRALSTPARTASLVTALAIVTTGAAAGANGSARWFFTPGPNRASCEMDVGRPGLPTQVWCVIGPPQVQSGKAVGVGLLPNGKLRVCRGVVCLGNAPERTRTLHYGRSVELGPFRCTSRRTGVRCVVTRLGRGFLLGAGGVSRI